MKHKCFLWPDHVIGKRESRRIREEHNAAVNCIHELTEALEALLRVQNSGNPWDSARLIARDAIYKAKGN